MKLDVVSLTDAETFACLSKTTCSVCAAAALSTGAGDQAARKIFLDIENSCPEALWVKKESAVGKKVLHPSPSASSSCYGTGSTG